RFSANLLQCWLRRRNHKADPFPPAANLKASAVALRTEARNAHRREGVGYVRRPTGLPHLPGVRLPRALWAPHPTSYCGSNGTGSRNTYPTRVFSIKVRKTEISRESLSVVTRRIVCRRSALVASHEVADVGQNDGRSGSQRNVQRPAETDTQQALTRQPRFGWAKLGCPRGGPPRIDDSKQGPQISTERDRRSPCFDCS